MQEVQRIDKVSGGGYVSPLDKIRRYIEKTGLSDRVKGYYALSIVEAQVLYGEAHSDPYNAIATAFNYGVAKGCRAAKAEARR